MERACTGCSLAPVSFTEQFGPHLTQSAFLLEHLNSQELSAGSSKNWNSNVPFISVF